MIRMKLRDYAIGANASMYYRLKFRYIKGVYYPRSEEDVLNAILKAKERGIDVTPKGGGSGLSGACTGGNRERFMISSIWMRELITISKDQGFIDVQPGATPDEINAVLEPMGMKLWVTPSSRDIATVGGILCTDGGGNDTWVNGSMRDNTLRVKMLLYNGKKLTVDWDGVKCEDTQIETELNKMGMTIHDIASSHGTLGFITELRLAIKPISSEETIGGIAEYADYNALGKALSIMIEKKSPVKYGEAIVMAHDDVREGLNPPLLTLEFPESYESEMKEITDFKKLPPTDVQKMKDIRIKLPKRQPKVGLQVALFEGYGFHSKSLLDMQHGIEEINALLIENELTPFAKYGHAPSKWYIGDNSPTYGLIMHSREIRPEGRTGKEIYATITQIVAKCEELRITPKPEHKWPFSDDVKKERIRELREVLGQGFNTFILEPDYDSVLGSMV